MSRWDKVATASITNDGGTLQLFKRDEDYAIRITGGQGDLMNSRTHDSEDALGKFACEPWQKKSKAQILIGGLGMGFTLSTALQTLTDDAHVCVAELVPGVIQWNREVVGQCAGYPLNDKRVEIENRNVGDLINQASGTYDSILLDVDNGPEGLTHPENDHLYSFAGLHAAYDALRSSGVLAVWSASPAPQFKSRLRKVGFSVEEKRVRAHRGRGSRHIIWLATRGR